MKSHRDNFRDSTFKRDNNRCVMCGLRAPIDQLDAHHICDRSYMPFGGYVLSNGITLCTDRSPAVTALDHLSGIPTLDCHRRAEMLHATGTAFPGYTPEDLYARIQSAYRIAYYESLRLGLSAPAAINIQHTIDRVLIEEIEVCVLLDCGKVNEQTWALACEQVGITEPLVLDYGKGRHATND